MNILKLFANRKAKRAADLRRRGFDYAAGRLLEDGAAAIEILEQHATNSRDFGDYNEFDEGVTLAIDVFNHRNSVAALNLNDAAFIIERHLTGYSNMCSNLRASAKYLGNRYDIRN